jgi:nicotinamide-nucleotide amidase
MPGKRENTRESALFNTTHIEVIRAGLLDANETIAVAESVTAGLLQLALASAEEASQFFQGGITAYNVGQKTMQLDIEPIHAIASNCVSQQVACEMSFNVCRRFRSHWGVGVTGFAVPVPESEHKVFAWYAICHRDKILRASRIIGKHQPTLTVQSAFVNEILARLGATIKESQRD